MRPDEGAGLSGAEQGQWMRGTLPRERSRIGGRVREWFG